MAPDPNSNGSRTLAIELRPTASLRPYAGNPRAPGHAVRAVAASIQQFGFRQPIVVDPDGEIVVGHTRWLAAQSLGLAEVPVHVAADLTPELARAYRIADNKTAELADWNPTLLAAELKAMPAVDWQALGFREAELKKLAAPDTRLTPLANLDPEFSVIVTCESEDHQRQTYEQIVGLGLKCKCTML